MHQVPNTSAAQTNVSEFITDLDGGQFDRMLSVALGEVAAGAVTLTEFVIAGAEALAARYGARALASLAF